MNKPSKTLVLAGLLAFVLSLSLTGCASRSHHKSMQSTHLIQATYQAVDKIVGAVNHNNRHYQFSKSRPIIVTSLADVDDVRYSSTFGRTIGEQVGSRLTQNGYKVIELKMRSNIFVPNPERGHSSGEFMLSRELRNISFEHDAQAILVGTYAAAKDIVYVTLKAVDARDNSIIASTDYSQPIDENMKQLLKDNRRRRN
ncbi:FlgO family outer membrane protein [Candidatus Venteria ishoeyi]|uniref:FlgO domain-containing protein n=1 Tax=Candidatus Venteria ishoeyi TaxID=1899563 RepID=A0A1H6FHH0_9GAMM|nr:FlgO family outer membrane protein [Candidatus Venteria ishoeyi]MDM8545543.1 FlgO family outer membrane protein [Candidatus Venteria ishoeyi]SEH08881.1 Uncharacterised protein [Candidatus Venteria ishoeyi]